jgi:hypothetical protein
VLVFARDPEDPDGEEGYRRVIVHAKSNWGRLAPSLAGEIASLRLEPQETGAERVIYTSRLVITGESQVTKADISRESSTETTDKKDLARHWLLEELARDTWHESGSVKVEAEKDGHSTRTLKRAFAELVPEGAGKVQRGGFPSRTYWLIHSGAKGLGATELETGGPTEPTRIVEPKTPDSAIQSGQTQTLAPLEQKVVCECTHPARSPRAVGRDFCQTCKRPIPGTE